MSPWAGIVLVLAMWAVESVSVPSPDGLGYALLDAAVQVGKSVLWLAMAAQSLRVWWDR